MSRSDATVYIVDDDASVREALAWLLRSRRLLSESFDSAEAFEQALGQAEPAAPACLLLDVRMPGASGLALFDRLVERGVAHAWPVIFLTGHASVATAVEALKRGAFDFCEKPFSDNALVDRIERRLAWIAPIIVVPGELELEALAEGAGRVLLGLEGEDPDPGAVRI